jgi:hypothetical protein
VLLWILAVTLYLSTRTRLEDPQPPPAGLDAGNLEAGRPEAANLEAGNTVSTPSA